MDRPIFETSFLGNSVQVFSSYLTYKNGFFGKAESIPLKQIASVDYCMSGVQQIIIETTGGKKIKILVRLRDKSALHSAILNNL